MSELGETRRAEVERRLDEVRNDDVDLVDAEERYARLRSAFTA